MVAVLLTGASARAHTVGTIFSGPTDGDAASIYWNPAAMSLSPTSRVDIVGNVSILQADYQRAGIDNQTGRPFKGVSVVAGRPEPLIGLILDRVYKKRLRLGLAVSVPSTSGAGWPETVNDNGATILGPTRYHVTSGTAFNLYAQLAASFQIHRVLAVGVTLNLVTSSVSLSKHVDLLNQPLITDPSAPASSPCGVDPSLCENPAFSAPITFNSTGFSVGATFGVLLTPIPRLRIGVAYATPHDVDMSVSVNIDTSKLEKFAQMYFPSFQPLNANGNGHYTLKIPQRVHSAIAFDVTKKLELMVGFRWVNNEATQVLSGQLTQRGSTLLPDTITLASVARDEYTVSARAAWQISERWKAGFLAEYTPHTFPDAFTSPISLDFDTLTLSLGAHFRARKYFAVGATFSQFIVFSRTITASAYGNDRAPPFNLPDPSGKYSGNAERVGIDFSFFF